MNELAASRTLYRGFLFLLAVIGAALLARQLIPVILELFTAAIIAAAMAPVCAWFTTSERALRWRWRPPRILVVLITYLVAGTVLLVFGSVIVAAIAREVASLAAQLPEFSDWLRTRLQQAAVTYPALYEVDATAWLSANIDSITSWMGGVLGGMVGFLSLTFALLGGALTGIFILLMALYLTVDGGRFRDYLVIFFPFSRQAQTKRMLQAMTDRLGHWAIGQIVLCFIVGGGAWIACSIIGVPYAALIGLIWALAEFMPGIGPFVSAIPTIILGFTAGPVTGVLAAIFSLAWSQLESNIITPKVMGDAVELHPLIILLSLLVGAELLGVAGALLAIPLAATFAVVVDELHAARRQSHLLAAAKAAETIETADGASLVVPPTLVQS